MKIKQRYLLILSAMVMLLAACGDDDDASTPVLPEPTLDAVEVGYSNNGIAAIGRDFHFNAEVTAGDKISRVLVRIQPRSGETYAKSWSHEIVWDQYKGAKNAAIHKHFDIPADAAEGTYDFVIIVEDENGATLEDVHTIQIFLPENLPVDPQTQIFTVFRNQSFFYRRGKFNGDSTLIRNDTLASQVTLGGIKGSGKMYLLLINKKHKHRPETAHDIDFSKVIVFDVYQHDNWTEGNAFTNTPIDPDKNVALRFPRVKIGAATDNLMPQGSPITGAKAWESGDYYFGVVYENTTYHVDFHQYIEFKISY